jgi:hypothetical protein
MLSVVSTNAMPAVHRAGKASVCQRDMPCAAWVAATPRRIARLMMETDVSMARPIALNASGPPCAAAIVAAIASEVRTPTVE